MEATAAEAARSLSPLSELQSLQGFEFIFDGADRQKLQELGATSTPNLAELFVAVVGAQQ